MKDGQTEGTALPPGLSAAAAAEALRRDGPNAVPDERPHPLRHRSQDR